MKLVIIAGGRGTRLGLKNIPKPMVEIKGKPLLEYHIVRAKKYGIKDIFILSGYMANVIIDYFGNGAKYGVNIKHIIEEKPLGTAGAVRQLEGTIHDRFMVLYGDVLFDIDIDSFIKYDMMYSSVATIIVHPNDHPYDSDLVEVNHNNQVINFHSKPHNNKIYLRNLVNAGIYILSPSIFKYIEKDNFSDFGQEIFPKLIAKNELIYAYNTPEYIKDIGTVNRFKKVEKDVISGKVYKLNKNYKQKAIFADRDGVLNYEVDSLKEPEELKLLPGVDEAIKKINQSVYLSVIVTNQPVIAKGFATEDILNQIHAKLETLIGENNAYIDRIYYCPHHPEKGFEGESKEYKIECSCRKPKIGMIEKAANELNIELSDSFLIGDTTVDMMTGKNAGLKTILVRTGYAGDDGRFKCEPDFVFDDFKESVEFILNSYENLYNMVNKILSNIFYEKSDPIIIVSGLSRSGKSTIAKIISIVLQNKGVSSKTLKLDNWLMDVDEREPWMTVRDRYDYENITKDIQSLLGGKKTKIYKYNEKTRKRTEQSEMLSLNPGEVLIIDGVVGLDIKYLRDISDLKFYVEVPEDIRKCRFYNYYRYKGLSENNITKLYSERQMDETELIVDTKNYSDHIINSMY